MRTWEDWTELLAVIGIAKMVVHKDLASVCVAGLFVTIAIIIKGVKHYKKKKHE